MAAVILTVLRQRNSSACNLCPASMMSRCFNCLLDETCEIIISVQILVTLWWTRRPLQFYCYHRHKALGRQFVWGGSLPQSTGGPQRYAIYIVMDKAYLTWLTCQSPRDSLLGESVIVIPSTNERGLKNLKLRKG